MTHEQILPHLIRLLLNSLNQDTDEIVREVNYGT